MTHIVLNKSELADALKTSINTLDKLIRRHGDAFPVLREGSHGVEWQFDPEAVTAFLQKQEDAARAAGRERDELMQQYALPDTKAQAPGLTAQDRIRLAKLRQLDRDEKVQAGELQPIHDARACLVDTFVNYQRGLQTEMRQVLRDQGIPEATIRSVESRVAAAQRKSVTQLIDSLTKAEAADDGGATVALQ